MLVGAILMISVGTGTVSVADAQPPPGLGPPTWSDEFTGTTLDLTRWSHRATGERNDGILAPNAVSVGDGLLTIKTYTDSEDKHYSGMISTERDGSTTGFEQKYGYFEARVKFDNAPGQWSAFWLQTPKNGDPLGDSEKAGVEMDIAEHRTRCGTAARSMRACGPSDDVENAIQEGVIWDGYDEHSKSKVQLSDPLPGLDNGSWHTWGLRWTPTGLTFYYDDTAIWSRSAPISRRSQFIVLSSEVGRFFAGPIPRAGYGSIRTTTTTMQVDYVRAWALD
jgi:endo-1,3-1,4-beta-glycanase ExoK